jgi:hypothetical protein
MTKERKRLFDVITESIKIIALIAGGIWAIITWQSEQKEHAVTAKRELQRPFYEKQLTLYLEASKVAAQLAYLKEHNKEDQAIEARFWQLYWGELALVESPASIDGAHSLSRPSWCPFVSSTLTKKNVTIRKWVRLYLSHTKHEMKCNSVGV